MPIQGSRIAVTSILLLLVLRPRLLRGTPPASDCSDAVLATFTVAVLLSQSERPLSAQGAFRFLWLCHLQSLPVALALGLWSDARPAVLIPVFQHIHAYQHLVACKVLRHQVGWVGVAPDLEQFKLAVSDALLHP